MDTTNILFICGGAFDGLDKIIEKRTDKSAIGFDSPVQSKSKRDVGTLFTQVEPHDLLKFGIIPELVGRMPVITTLRSLSRDDLVRILVEPKNALTKQYQKLLEMDGVALEIQPEALQAIAQKALPQCNIVYRVGDEMKADVNAYLKVLYDASPAAVGGKLPDANFYYTKATPGQVFWRSVQRSFQ